MSLRQYAPTNAGVADETRAIAVSAAIGTTLHFKKDWM